MNRSEALDKLNVGSPYDRLRAARELSKLALPEDLPSLEQALERENDSWTRLALQQAVATVTQSSTAASDSSGDGVTEESSKFNHESFSIAVEHTTRILLHEISPIVARLADAAAREVENFTESRTNSEIVRLRGVLASIRQMSVAASAPEFVEFDLAELADTERNALDEPQRELVLNTGRNPFFVRGDTGLIQIILRNGLSNALEAAAQNPEEHKPEIIVTWGARGTENWIRVLDNGPGLKVPVSRVFLPGTSAKPGHFGLGLTIVDLASRSLDGSIELTPREERGVRFEFQWPRTE